MRQCSCPRLPEGRTPRTSSRHRRRARVPAPGRPPARQSDPRPWASAGRCRRPGRAGTPERSGPRSGRVRCRGRRSCTSQRAGTHLDEPGPDLGGARADGDRVCPPDLRVGHPLITRQRPIGLAGKRTNRTPRYRARHEDPQEPQRISNERDELSITTQSCKCVALPPEGGEKPSALSTRVDSRAAGTARWTPSE
jgi:hypothetical protein